jgi:hypothetical protein
MFLGKSFAIYAFFYSHWRWLEVEFDGFLMVIYSLED